MEKNYCLNRKKKRASVFKIEKESDNLNNKRLKLEETKEKDNNNDKDSDIMFETEKENEIEKEYDYNVKIFKQKLIEICSDFKDFKYDYTIYCYNNLKELKTSEAFKKLINDIKSNPSNNALLKEICEFINNREDKIRTAEEYSFKNYIKKISEKILDIPSGSTAFTENFNELNKEEQEELFISALIESSFKKMRIEEEKFDTSRNKDTNKKPEIKIEVQNFNLQEKSLFALFNGIKFNNTLSVINLDGNPLTPRACFCLGNIFLYNKQIKLLSLVRCYINNNCLEMLVKGASHISPELNKEPIYIEQLNLKDNDIDEKDNYDKEYSLSLIIIKFIIKKLNLSNTKIKNEGLIKISNTIIYILNNNEKSNFQLETLNLFNIGIQNEECLESLGNVFSHKKCTIQNLILSKNKITTFVSQNQTKNYFENFLDKIKDNNSLKELVLLKCDIGKNKNDVIKLCEMLGINKTLESLKLFDNLINDYNDFVKFLDIVSYYKKDKIINNTLKNLDISKNHCNIRINEDFLNMIESSNLENLDINQNKIDEKEKEIFRRRTNSLDKIKIIY